MSLNQTATQATAREHQDKAQSERMHWLHKTFRERYAPSDPINRDAFEADLAMLLREVALDALKPFQDAAAMHIALRPMPPVVLKTGGHE